MASTTLLKSATVTIELPYPTGSGNHHTRGKAGGGRYLTKAALAYRTEVAVAVGLKRAPAGRLAASWLLSPPDRRVRDLDNVLKPACDALTHCRFWPDDGNQVLVAGSWEWAEPTPGGAIQLTLSAL